MLGKQKEKIMDRITESFLNKFIQNTGIQEEKEATRFEHFSNYSLVDSQIDYHYKIEDINIGVGGTIGIDGFALILNGHLITEIDELTDILNDQKNCDAKLIFIQAKTSAGFDAKEISSFAYSVFDFISESPKQVWTQIARERIDLLNALFKRVSELREKPTCSLYYVSLGKLSDNQTINARISSGKQDIESENLFSKVDFSLFGATEIQSKFKEIGQSIQKSFEFEKRVTLPEIQGVSEAYLGIVRCVDIAKIMENENGEIISNIFYDNVRDYQGQNPVNSEITRTLNSSTKEDFVLLNNGITIVAEELILSRNTFNITNFQIINGCQTSHVLFENREKLNDNVYVSLKLIITKDKELTSKVIRSTNRQTEVKEQDLIAFTDFQKRLEDFYTTFNEPNRLYYERRSKQYSRLSIERQKIVDKTQQIKTMASMFFDKPDLATRFFGTLFREFKDKLFADDHNMEPYYVSAFALYKLEQMILKGKIDRKYNKIKFYILMMLRYEVAPTSCPYFNSKAVIEYSENILSILNDESKLTIKIQSVISKLDSLALDLTDRELSKSKKLVNDCLAFYKPKKLLPNHC